MEKTIEMQQSYMNWNGIQIISVLEAQKLFYKPLTLEQWKKLKPCFKSTGLYQYII